MKPKPRRRRLSSLRTTASAAILCLLTVAAGACADRSGPPEEGESTPLPSPGLTRPITHGTASTDAAHAAVLQMLYLGEEICTATLITDTIALTAAHCVYVKDCQYNYETGRSENCQLETVPARFSFRVGRSAGDAARQSRTATAIFAHEGYDDASLVNDIALLRLASPFRGVTPIPALPDSEGLAWSAADAGKASVTYVGFGLTETGASGARLQVTSRIDLVCPGPSACSDYTSWYAPPRSVCSYMSAGGTCNGDSGGPALLVRSGVTYVAGVTSFGDEDCASFGCSTSVSGFAGWIAERIGDELANGQGCVSDGQCASGFCVQGLCCNERCGDALCEACSAARGAASDGVCGPIVSCAGETDCALAGTCDPASGACLYEPKSTTTVCDDGDACTLDDHCLLGACVGAGSVYCAPPGECQIAGESACEAATGACHYEPLPDGTQCSAGECRAGRCAKSSSGSGSGCGAAGGSSPAASALVGLFLGICLAMKRRGRT